MNAQLSFGTVFTNWMPKFGRRRAAVRAHVKFEKRYPEYSAALFDEHFLANQADNILSRYISSERPQVSFELARAWAGQVWMNEDSKAALILEVVPAAADYLRLFESALSGRDVVGEMAAQATGG